MRVKAMTNAVMNMIGWRAGIAAENESAAASEMLPRMPDHAMNARCRDGGISSDRRHRLRMSRRTQAAAHVQHIRRIMTAPATAAPYSRKRPLPARAPYQMDRN